MLSDLKWLGLILFVNVNKKEECWAESDLGYKHLPGAVVGSKRIKHSEFKSGFV
jgi:hypothetical protein